MSGYPNAKDEDGVEWNLDNIATTHWLRGHYCGLEAAADWLRARATALFVAKKHDEAIKMQKLADEMTAELEPQMRKAAEKHEREHPDDESDDE